VLIRNFFWYNEKIQRLARRQRPGNVVAQRAQPFLVPEPPKVAHGWAKTFRYLERLQSEAASDGVCVVIMIIPVKLQFHEVRYREILENLRIEAEQIGREQPVRRVADFCHRLNIPLLNQLPAIRKYHSHTPCYFQYDDHWNATGVKVSAGLVVQEWREAGLAPFDGEGTGALYQGTK
jgi:hypothetical protein